MSSPDKEDVAALTAAGFSRDEIKRWIAPMATSRPRQISDPDGYMWDVELVECTEFFTWEYSHEFEHLCDETNANEVPTLKLGALHRRKKLTEDASAVIGKIVLNNRQLFCLNVEFEGDKEILFAFFRHWHGKKCNLQCLEVGYSGFGGTSEFGPFIKRLLKDNAKMVELKLTHTEMTLDDCKDMASALSASDTLKHLSLMWNRVGDPGAKIISEAVAGMPRMETIDFWGNDIFKYESIAKMVLGSPQLRKINLAFCLGRESSGCDPTTGQRKKPRYDSRHIPVEVDRFQHSPLLVETQAWREEGREVGGISYQL